MGALRSLLFLVVVCAFAAMSLGAAFVAGQSTSPRPLYQLPEVPAYEFARADAPQGLMLANSDTCVAPTDLELALVEAALNVIAFPDEMTSFLGIGAEKLLSRPVVRWVDGKPVVVCDDPEAFQQAQRSMEEHGRLLRGRLVEYGFALISRLPNPGAALIRKVAESAFSDTRQESEILRRDLRPLARATLAAIEGASTPYAERAFAEISIEDSMGTGAAQIAVAGGHPQALRKVQELMDQLLSALPAETPIPWDQRNRLYEMAQALAYGGQAAKEHVAPLRELMNRKVESNATIFGMVALPPRRMCPLLEHILQVPVAETEYSYCLPQSGDFVLEQ